MKDQEHYLEMFRKGRFLIGGRQTGKTTALLKYAWELRESGQEPTIVTASFNASTRMLSLWTDLYAPDPCPRIIIGDPQQCRGLNGPNLVDEFLHNNHIHSLPLNDGVLFRAGISSEFYAGFDTLEW